MIIQHNISAMNANRQLGVTGKNASKSTEKLSSGYRINRAADDAAGLAISEKMRGQIRGLGQASTNSEDAISLIQTAEGGLQETQNILQRMRELSVQAASDTNTEADRDQIQQEIDQLTNEVDRIASSSEFNTKKLLDGSQTGAIKRRNGNSRIEGSFQNGTVAIKGLADSKLVGIEDVIRITILKDITGTFSAGTDMSEIVRIESLNGSHTAVYISSGSVEISQAAFTSAAMTNTSSDISFAISGFTSLKAGDVITISLAKANPSAAPSAGKEGLNIQVGANAGQEVNLAINSMKAKDLNIVTAAGEALDVTMQSKASMAVEAFDKALDRVSSERAKLGAMQNRLEHTISNLDTSGENLQASESRIRDVDMAEEMTEYSKNNILMQAGQSMLAQANQSTQGVLSLLQQ